MASVHIFFNLTQMVFKIFLYFNVVTGLYNIKKVNVGVMSQQWGYGVTGHNLAKYQAIIYRVNG
jgi:hypothetical protein